MTNDTTNKPMNPVALTLALAVAALSPAAARAQTNPGPPLVALRSSSATAQSITFRAVARYVRAADGSWSEPSAVEDPTDSVTVAGIELLSDLDGDGDREIAIAVVATSSVTQPCPPPFESSPCTTTLWDRFVVIYDGSEIVRVLVPTGYAGPSPHSSSYGDVVRQIGDLIAVSDPDNAVVYLYRLAATSSDPHAELRLPVDPPPPGALFGAALSTAGDLDGDGAADILVGAPGTPAPPGSNTLGSAYLFSGASGALFVELTGASLLQDHTPPEATPSPILGFGAALSGGDDFDGDGVPDVAIGHPGWTPAGATSHPSCVAKNVPAQFCIAFGRVYVISGLTGGFLHVADGEHFRAELGTRVAFLGDLDGDGRSELAASAPRYQTPAVPGIQNGRVEVYSASSPTPICAPMGLGQGKLGFELSAVGDPDGDGRNAFAATSDRYEGPYLTPFGNTENIKKFMNHIRVYESDGAGGCVETEVILAPGHQVGATTYVPGETGRSLAGAHGK